MSVKFHTKTIVALPLSSTGGIKPTKNNHLIDIWIFDDNLDNRFTNENNWKGHTYVCFVSFSPKNKKGNIWWNLKPKSPPNLNNLDPYITENDLIQEYKNTNTGKIMELSKKEYESYFQKLS
mgnify:FL=1